MLQWLSNQVLKDPISRRRCIYFVLPIASLFCFVVFLGGTSRALCPDEIVSKLKRDSGSIIWKIRDRKSSERDFNKRKHNFATSSCKNQCRPAGSESLPRGIVVESSNLARRPLWGSPQQEPSKSLFVVTVGIKQKETVDKMVKKFLSSNFAVIVFHYDGIVEGWSDLEWSNNVTHIASLNQTKWWFSKRFLHPDIVSEYNYIFLWDEDLGVENFDPERYLSIVKEEGLEISQPALDTKKSEVHHQITARRSKARVHRRIYKVGNKDQDNCDNNSNAPPCAGWIEVMAPVFSRDAWRCTWYLIQVYGSCVKASITLSISQTKCNLRSDLSFQNDLIHAWGLDMKLGYCAQGDRTQNIGVVDDEYIVHYGVPTLGDPNTKATFQTKSSNFRVEVRRQSYREYREFLKRWKRAVVLDKCWKDPYL